MNNDLEQFLEDQRAFNEYYDNHRGGCSWILDGVRAQPIFYRTRKSLNDVVANDVVYIGKSKGEGQKDVVMGISGDGYILTEHGGRFKLSDVCNDYFIVDEDNGELALFANKESFDEYLKKVDLRQELARIGADKIVNEFYKFSISELEMIVNKIKEEE